MECTVPPGEKGSSLTGSDSKRASTKVVGVIPARLQSTRLPRKLLLSETGRPLVQYVWEAALRATCLSDVVIATDSTEIQACAERFGGRCVLTGDHPSGTDRVAEVVRRSFPDADVVVNLQGDEPELDPEYVSELVHLLDRYPTAHMATLATPLTDWERVTASSCVKVVLAADHRALYFSRAPIPFCRDRDPHELLRTEQPWLLHVGLYAYRREFLLELTERPVSRLEGWEKLEQLRALEAGAEIRVGLVAHPTVGIDTPEDYARFVERQRSRPHQVEQGSA
jgi:3-deoxy-manno-octulosonate cytidylyltransferase (CMP-KDO synthetase)